MNIHIYIHTFLFGRAGWRFGVGFELWGPPDFNTERLRLEESLYVGCGILGGDASDHQDLVTFSVGDPYKPSFTTGILGGGHIQGIILFIFSLQIG